MRRGFLLDRAASAKAKAPATLQARQPAQGTPTVTHDAQDPEEAPQQDARQAPAAAHRAAVFRERIRLAPGASLDGNWPAGLPMPSNCSLTPKWVPDTVSDANLQMWCEWSRRFPAAAERLRPLLFIIQHRCPYEPGVRHEPLPGNLRTVECSEPDCERCQQQRGGYRFWWSCAFWTPRLANGSPDLAGRITPNARRACIWHAAWPLGIAVPPGGDVWPDPGAVSHDPQTGA